MIKKTVSFTVVYLTVLALAIAWVSSFHTNLFFNISWIFLLAIIAGAIAGIFRAKVKLSNADQVNDPPRHTLFSFMEHWGTGIGIIILIVSAILLGFVVIPHTSHPSIFPANLHFIGLFFTLLFGSYSLAHFLISREYRMLMPNLKDIWDGTIKKYLLRKKWNDSGKYLSSQKSAFLAFVVLGFGVLVTGAIKTVSVAWQNPSLWVFRVSYAHDIFAILFILMLIVHILSVIVVCSHRRLLYSWFTGQDGIEH